MITSAASSISLGIGVGVGGGSNPPGPDTDNGLMIDSSGAWFLFIDGSGHYLTI